MTEPMTESELQKIEKMTGNEIVHRLVAEVRRMAKELDKEKSVWVIPAGREQLIGDGKFQTIAERLSTLHDEIGRLTQEVTDLQADHIGLMKVSGALMDASTIPVPQDPLKYGDAVRALAKERDALKHNLMELCGRVGNIGYTDDLANVRKIAQRMNEEIDE